MAFDPRKYRPTPAVKLPDRTWPDQVLTQAPIWCSVDLRDGNQALIEPMGADRKLRFFETLVAIGLKEIEIGFPSASQTDYDFLRFLVDEGRIPDDVTIQVLVPAREHLINRTIEALRGVHKAIIHLYNSTSEVQRRIVFKAKRGGIRQLAVDGAKMVRDRIGRLSGTEIAFEYSPESFTGTELDFAVEVCNAVAAEWRPTTDAKMIVNLPATVEVSTPNIYADQIEWMCRHLEYREATLVSLHTHNDRGCGVAATELALLAGADRVEGTLFGNGERTGNVDIVTLALNLYSQGIHPDLDLSDIPRLVETFEYCNQLPIPARHPYAGELVFTAFSGSHQDAIKKGVQARSDAPMGERGVRLWEVPYLPIDPADIGRVYEPLVRINSQSGKSGIAFVLEHTHGYRLPKKLAVEFSREVQKMTDASGRELSPFEILKTFEQEYLAEQGYAQLVSFSTIRDGDGDVGLSVRLKLDDAEIEVVGHGNGPLDALVQALESRNIRVRVLDYQEHALGHNASATAVAYVECRAGSGISRFGVGRDPDIMTASLKALLGGLSRLRQVEMAGALSEQAQ